MGGIKSLGKEERVGSIVGALLEHACIYVSFYF